MKAITVDDQQLCWSNAPTPAPGPGEVRIKVHAAGVNRADLVQRTGRYPPPPGVTDVLGLEVAGVVDALGQGVMDWNVGNRVAALLAGGGYAQAVCCPAGHLFRLPDELDFISAAALPEAMATAWLNLVDEAGMKAGDRVLIHAGASGVGTMAIQVCRLMGADCWVTVGTEEKVQACIALGASDGCVRHDMDLALTAKEWTNGRGMDIILCPVGAPYLAANQRCLALDGRLVTIGIMGGRSAELDLGRLLVKRQRIMGSTLRSRSDAFKTKLVADLLAGPWNKVKAVVDCTFSIEEAEQAHARLKSNQTIGKVVMTVPQ